jgi:hypothetical protein
MAVLGPLQVPGVESSVPSLGHIIEETEVLASEWRWTSHSSEAVHPCLLPEVPRQTHVEPIVSTPALKTSLRKNVGFRFLCDCPGQFPTNAGHKLVGRGIIFVNRLPDL